ncbi:MAG TPA: hypothetical protein VFX31_09640, partial [Ktedonobacterales bacterium]|nr:hypothetical protein [Ktedonobacterales bacterium]
MTGRPQKTEQRRSRAATPISRAASQAASQAAGAPASERQRLNGSTPDDAPYYLIEGGAPLCGEVTLSGAKNAATKLMVASLL